jgi:drug/metabolite transporter (DMT)-like permease
LKPRGTNPRLGVALKIGSVFGFTLMAACVKAGAAVVPIGQVCFFRAFFALLTLLAYLAWRGELPGAMLTSNPWGHFWRGLLGLTAMLLNFLALAYLPLPDAIALGYAMPLFLTIFAAVFLGETVRAFRWAAVLVGLGGVLIILWPRLSFLKGEEGLPGEMLGAMCALGGAVVVALGSAVVSRLILAERTSTVVFYFSLISSIGFLLTAPFGWRLPDSTTLALMVLSGILGGISQVMMTESYRYADTSAVAPFEYTSMLFGIALGFFVFGDMPTATMLFGASIVIASGLMVLWREHGHAPRANAAPPARGN